MKYFILLSLLYIAFIPPSSQSKQIKNVDIWYIPWNYHFRSAMDLKRAMTFRRTEQYQILDQRKLEGIELELSKLNPVNSSYSRDIRLVCEIQYGVFKKETLTIAKGEKLIQYKNKVYSQITA